MDLSINTLPRYLSPRCLRNGTYGLGVKVRWDGRIEAGIYPMTARPVEVSMYESLYLHYCICYLNGHLCEHELVSCYFRNVQETETLRRCCDRFIELRNTSYAVRIQRWFKSWYYSPGGNGYRAALNRFQETRADRQKNDC